MDASDLIPEPDPAGQPKKDAGYRQVLGPARCVVCHETAETFHLVAPDGTARHVRCVEPSRSPAPPAGKAEAGE